MAEHDYAIANDTGANVRSDINNVLSAIVSQNSKATEPSTTYAYMWWADTGNDLLKQRNAADDGWLNVLKLSTGNPDGYVIGTDVQAYDATIVVDADIGSTVQAYDADTLKADTADELTAGYSNSVYDAGTKSSGTYTPDEANGNVQKAVNGGAHTLAPPSNNCTLVIQYTNNASAGAITTSGFTLVDGDTISTTNGDDFFFYITKANGFSLLTVKALQ